VRRVAFICLLLSASLTLAQDAPPPVVAEITRELTKHSSDPAGRPLPVVSHWANGFGGTNFSSDYQTRLLEQGRHVMPTLPLPEPGVDKYPAKGSETVRKLAAWRAPITLRSGQWEQLLLSPSQPVDAPGKWRNLPPDENPRVLGLDGKLQNMISPFGAVGPWREVGQYTASSGGFAQLEEWYPDPPIVILLSNNEATRLKPKHKVESLSKRYVDRYGTGTSDEFQRKVIGDAYIERCQALLNGMREGLASDAWRGHSIFVAYDAFGPPHFGRWDGWADYSFSTDDSIDPWRRAWDGASVSYYTHNWNDSTDYRVWSPQVEAMNWLFMLDEVRREKPDFWFELSIWDGNWGTNPTYAKEKSKADAYRAAGQAWSPERYAGFALFGMWLTTPRVMREFRGHAVYLADYQAEFEALVRGVDRVWSDPVLERFWRKGELVPNPSRRHPYQESIPKKWRDAPRWYLLDTSAAPRWGLHLTTELPVFSLARVLGEKGSREWLVYAHSPLGPRPAVQITLPGFGNFTADITSAGVYYLVSEKDRTTTPLNP
jgi:hypothetical protein